VEVRADINNVSHLASDGSPMRWAQVPDRQAICRSDDTSGAVLGIFGPVTPDASTASGS
jgi:hypothetical protein